MEQLRYSRLSDDEREDISRGIEGQLSLRELARLLHRSPSTVSREVRRNEGLMAA